MPFTKAKDLDSKDLTFIYENIIRKAISTFRYNDEIHFQNVARFESNVGSIIEGIVNNLNDSELVIADLTGFNPNVMYELGVRHSLRRGTIIITQNIIELPSDLRDYLAIEYKYYKNDAIAQANYYQEFETKVHAAIIEVIAQTKNDSPVLNYLNQRQRFRNELELEKIKENFVFVHTMVNTIHELDDMFLALNPHGYEYNENLRVIEMFQLRITVLQESLAKLNLSFTSKSLFNCVLNAKILVASILRIFNKFFEILTSIWINKKSSQLPSINAIVETEIINNFTLEKGILEVLPIKELFKEEGVLVTNLLDPLTILLEKRIEELGIEKDDVLKLTY